MNETVNISKIAMDLIRKEQKQLMQNGISMSLGAIISKTIVERFSRK